MVAALACTSLGRPGLLAAAQPVEPTDEGDDEDDIVFDEGDENPEESDDAVLQAVLDSADRVEVETEPETTQPPPSREPPPVKDEPPNRRKAITVTATGYGFLGVGLGLATGMGAAIGKGVQANKDAKNANVPSAEQDRVDALDAGKRANTMALGLGFAAGAVLLTGIILVGVGHVRLKKSRESKTAFRFCSPTAGADGVGVGCTFSF